MTIADTYERAYGYVCPRCGVRWTLTYARTPGLCRDCHDVLTRAERIEWST